MNTQGYIKHEIDVEVHKLTYHDVNIGYYLCS